MSSNYASIFNDVIGPVMRGPSSSHCAAALRIGRIARDLMDGRITEVVVSFDRKGSLPTTHTSQGSDMGLFGGLLGWNADDPRLPESAKELSQEGICISFQTVDVGDPHPNTYRLLLKNEDEEHSIIAVSTGGGAIGVISIDELPIKMDGGYNETLIWLPEEKKTLSGGYETIMHQYDDGALFQVKGSEFVSDEILNQLQPLRVRKINRVLPVPSRKGISVPFKNAAEMVEFSKASSEPMWRLAVQYECLRGGIDELRVMELMTEITRIVKNAIQQGLGGTEYRDRILDSQSVNFEKSRNEGNLLEAGALNRIIAYTTAIMEVKSSMGIIVAMPTAGACAALPATVVGMAEEMGLEEEAVVQALLSAGLIGVFIANDWTFAAEAGGCQTECGAASAMSAAALVTLAGGKMEQNLAAASMALQNQLGLVCDPVANRVEVPCLGRNVGAAANAVACANMALAGYQEIVPFDEVIDSARRISDRMAHELRCTALGGLSITPTSQRIEKELAERQR